MAKVSTAAAWRELLSGARALDRGGYRLGVFTTATRRAATTMFAAAGLTGSSRSSSEATT